MSKTDGIGTWVWNENMNFDASIQFVDLDFVSNNEHWAIIEFVFNGVDGDNFIAYDIATEDMGTPVWSSTDGGWTYENEAFRTIDVKTAPSSDFLATLRQFAVYQEPTPDKYKLLDQNGNLLEINGMTKGTLTYEGKTYEWDNGASETPEPESGIGTWKWNNIIPVDSFPSYPFYFGFVSNSTQFSSFDVVSGSRGYGINYDATSVYTTRAGGWNLKDESTGVSPYQTINITSEPPAEFLEILKANAVKQA